MAFEFLSTPDEAQSITTALIESGFFANARVQIETALNDDAPWRTTVLATGTGPTVLVEVQKNPRYDDAFRNLARWLSANRTYTHLFLATSVADHFSGELITNLKRDGTGFIVVQEDGTVEIVLESTCPALRATPDPSLKLGKCQAEFDRLIKRFNAGDRKGAFQDVCEVVERETSRVFDKALSKGAISLTSKTKVAKLNWANKIEILGSTERRSGGGEALITTDLKNDLNSFRGARNMVDHPPKNKREAVRREQQFTERMMMAPRLIAELNRLHSAIK